MMISRVRRECEYYEYCEYLALCCRIFVSSTSLLILILVWFSKMKCVRVWLEKIANICEIWDTNIVTETIFRSCHSLIFAASDTNTAALVSMGIRNRMLEFSNCPMVIGWRTRLSHKTDHWHGQDTTEIPANVRLGYWWSEGCLSSVMSSVQSRPLICQEVYNMALIGDLMLSKYKIRTENQAVKTPEALTIFIIFPWF